MNLLKKSKEKKTLMGSKRIIAKNVDYQPSAFMESKRIAVKNIVKVKK